MGQPTAGAGNPFEQMLAQAAAQSDQPLTEEQFTCEECGTKANMLPPVNLQIIGDDEAMKLYDFTGSGGLCRVGKHFICWKHLEFRNIDSSAAGAIGRQVLVCKQHGEQVEGVSAEAMERWRARGGPDRLEASRKVQGLIDTLDAGQAAGSKPQTSAGDVSQEEFLELAARDPEAARRYLEERMEKLPPPQTPEEELAFEILKNATKKPGERRDSSTLLSQLQGWASEEEQPKRRWFRRKRR